MRKITVCKAFLLTALLLAMAWSEGYGQSANDVIINEIYVNPATSSSKKEFVEFLVTKQTGVDIRNWELTDLGSNSTNSGATEGTLRFKNRPFLSNLFYGCRIVVVTVTPRTEPNLLSEDTVAVSGSDSTIILLHPELGGSALDTVLNGAGTQSVFDLSTSENIVLLNGPIATGTVVDYVGTGSNASLSNWTAQGAVWSNNVTAGTTQYAYFTNGTGGTLINDDGSIGWTGALPHGTETMGMLNPGQILPSTVTNDPPTAFDLIEPADGYRWVVEGSSMETLTFRWNTSTDPEGHSVRYMVEYDTAMTMSSGLHGYIASNNEGLDTFFVDTSSYVYDFLNGLGLDSVTIYWQIIASDSVNQTTSNQMYAVTFVKAPNDPPSAFDLIEPADGFRWEVGMSSMDSIYYRWNRSIDPESNPVYYSFEYDTAATMDSPLHDYYFIGTDTFFVDYARLDAEWLHSLGLDSMTLYWRIVATDSLHGYVTSNQLWSIKYVLIPEPGIPFRAQLAGYQVVPPTNSQFTGWGYFEMSSDSSNLFYRIYIPDGVSPVTIRNNWAGSGSDEPVLYEYPLVGDSAVGNQAIPIEIARELCAGRLYVLHPGVGIRGQIYQGTAPVTLNPARELNAIEFEGSIELDWTEPLFYESAKHYRFSDKQFSRRKHDTPSRAAASSGAPLLTGYNIYRSTDGIGFIKIHQTDLLYFIDSNVTTGNNYWYFVSAVYLEGQAPWTDTVVASPAIPYSFVEGFNDTTMTVPGTLPEGWTKVDADGGDEDPFTGEWRVVPELDSYFTPYEGEGMMSINYEAANPEGLIDEWLISPYLEAGTTAPRLSFFVHASADFWPDSLQVLISTTDNNLTSFTPIDYFEGQGVWTEYNYDLSAYGITAGDSFYVAFRYLIYDGGSYGNSSDLINLDYVRIDGNPIVLSVNDPVAGAPKQFALHQNYPNPFNPSTAITYDIKDPGKVSIKIYNTLGQEVRTLVNAKQNAGTYSIMWDGRNNAGQAVSSGIYIYRMQTGNFIQSRKMMFLK